MDTALTRNKPVVGLLAGEHAVTAGAYGPAIEISARPPRR